MPAYPVGRGGIMLNGTAAPASAIINNGPGLLYLYRNSAVSAYAYDTVIGPSGSFQWPGGELWAASDAGTTVNVLAGLSSFDSGTTNVAGTVSVAGGSGGSSIRSRGATTGSGGGVNEIVSTAPPSGLAVGDLMITMADSANASWVPALTGAGSNEWTFGQNMQAARFYYKTVTSADLTRNVQWQNGNQVSFNVIVCAFTATALTYAGFRVSSGVLQTGDCTSPAYLFALSTAALTCSWGNAAAGGPPNPNAWANASGLGVTTASWSNTTSYPFTASISGTLSIMAGRLG